MKAFLFISFFFILFFGYGQSIEDKISLIRKGTSSKSDITSLFGKPSKKDFTENGETWYYNSYSVAKEENVLSGGVVFSKSNKDVVEKNENIFFVVFNQDGIVSSFKYSNISTDDISEDDRKNFQSLIERVVSEKLQGELKYKNAKVTIGKYENSSSQLETASPIFLMNQIVWKNYIALYTKDPIFNEQKLFNMAIDLIKQQDPTANSIFIYKELNKKKKTCRNGKCYSIEKVNNRTMLLIYPSSDNDLQEIK